MAEIKLCPLCLEEHEVMTIKNDESVKVQGIKFDCEIQYNVCPNSEKRYEGIELYESNQKKYSEVIEQIKELTGLTTEEIFKEINAGGENEV